MMRTIHLLAPLLLLIHHVDGDGLLHGLLRRVDLKKRRVLQHKIVEDPGFGNVRRLTSSGSDNKRYVHNTLLLL